MDFSLDKQIIDGKQINCPCYIDRPLYRYDKGCLIQSQAFTEQQTEEKPILRCDEIKNCMIKDNAAQLKRLQAELEEKNKEIKRLKTQLQEAIDNYIKLDLQRIKENEEWINKLLKGKG